MLRLMHTRSLSRSVGVSALTLVVLAALTILSGCQSFKQGARETVVITSFPDGASVTVDGVSKGITPLVLELRRATTHQVLLTKAGYRDHGVTLAPVPNERSANVVKFGLLADQGYYASLSPNPVEIDLVSTIIPRSEGVDPFSEMGRRVLEADTRLQTGEISKEEHDAIVQGLIRFYGASGTGN